MTHVHHPLDTGWTLRPVGNVDQVPETIRSATIPATVPGCVHTDLLRAGLIPDPYIATHERDLMWIGETDWEYRCRFAVSAEMMDRPRVDLVCEGLDTVATIAIDGQVVGEAANMHHPHRFDVREVLTPGEHELVVTFGSPVRAAAAALDYYGHHPYMNQECTSGPFHMLRKMVCGFGWDWGPMLTTAGIWKPISLHGWGRGRIDAVRPLVLQADEDRAVVRVCIDAIAESEAGTLDLGAAIYDEDGTRLCAERVEGNPGEPTVVELVVPKPQRWWPRGHGEQPMYSVKVKLKDDAGETIDQWHHRIGLRTVALNTEADADGDGSRMRIEVNGKAIFCKGANWIPDDCFLDRVDEQRYRARIEQACGANMNMLRVWGGGIFETDTFYEICDELGVMVWQDFLFACAAYPEEEPMRSQVEAEARHNVARLSRHPSLVLWNGCNENLWGYFDWGWQDALEDKTWGSGYYFDLLPKIMAELDPSRPYWPGSPYSGTMEIHPNHNDHGNRHVWDAWFGGDYEVYREHLPRFASEFGFQGACNWATLAAAVAEEDRGVDSDAMLHRQRCPDGQTKVTESVTTHFGFDPAKMNFDDWHYLSQINQARALALGVEWFRSLGPDRCMGSLYWQLNDCWPAMSWSAIDVGGPLRPLWYATRRFYADRLLTIQPVEGDEATLHLVAVNDSDEPWVAHTAISRMDFVGIPQYAAATALSVEPRSIQRFELPAELTTPGDAGFEMVLARAGDVQATWFYGPDRELRYETADFRANLTQVADDRWKLAIEAETLLRDVCLMVDRLDPAARVSEQAVTILGGETFTFVIQSAMALDEKALTSPPVFWCVNRFGATGG